MNKDYDSIKEIEADITRISCQLVDAAQSSISPSKHQRNILRRSMTLTYLLCVGVVMLPSISGRLRVPTDLAHSMTKERNARKMSVYLSQCQAQLQRKVIQKRDQAFHSHHPKRFKTSSQKSGGTSLLINGSLNSDPSSVLPLWADHFSNLSTSRLSNNPFLQKIWNTIPEVEIATLVDEISILDVSFVPEEVDAAINHLKRSSSASPYETLSPQHLIFAGPLLKSWLCKVFNTIVNFEAIPSQFKVGIIVPIYKGKGKDPLLPGSYRGITLTSVIAKTFEYLLDSMLPVLSDNCVPHLNQIAY